MEDCPPIVSLNTSVKTIAVLLKEYPLVVVNEHGKNLGIITKSDLIQKTYV